MLSDLDVSFIFPPSGPITDARLPSTGSRWVPVRPLHWYYSGTLTRCHPSQVLRFLVPDTANLGGNGSASQVPWQPFASMLRSLTPARRQCQAFTAPPCCLPQFKRRRLSRWKISRLNHEAYLLAVYASPVRLPVLDARLASDCWLALSGGLELLFCLLHTFLRAYSAQQPRWVTSQGFCSLH